MKRNSVLSLIGLAKKAGKIAAGEFQTENSVKSGKACLVIVSEEASANTKKKFRNMCTFYEVPIYYYGNKTELGAAIGYEFRASLALLDPGLAEAAIKHLETVTKDAREGVNADGTCPPDSEKDGGYADGKNQSS